MTLEQLKERIEAQCMKHGFEIDRLVVESIEDSFILCSFKIIGEDAYVFYLPDVDLLLERIDHECRVIKAFKSSATNGLDL